LIYVNELTSNEFGQQALDHKKRPLRTTAF